MKDIENRDDIIQLVDAFYEKLLKDPAMIPVFEPSMINWNEHIERVYNFWDNWLFKTGSYTGGLMWVHIDRNRSYPLSVDLFELWLAYWNLSIDKLFQGKNANIVKNKALEIGQIMNAKLNNI